MSAVGAKTIDKLGIAMESDVVTAANSNGLETHGTSLPDTASPAKRNESQAAEPKKERPLSLLFKAVTGFFSKYWPLKIVQLLCGLYIALMTFTPIGTFKHGGLMYNGLIIDPASVQRTSEGVILLNGDLRPVVASTGFQMFCLGLTRISAYFMYPALVLIFFSKFRFTLYVLGSTPLAMFLFQDFHDLHVYCGWIIFIDSIVHSTFHTVRWGAQDNVNLLIDHRTGITGIILIISLLCICIPMMFEKLKRQVKFEVRKFLHYLFLAFAIALAMHTPPSGPPNGGFTAYIFTILLVWYAVDSILVMLFMSEKIETTMFHVLPSGVQLTMAVSDRFQRMGNHGGYCYVCFPWVDRFQWHAYSLFENPSRPQERQIFLQRLGDWTNTVHRLLQRSTARPVWIQGPFPSPYSLALDYDNQIMVASGIGITPALSVIRAAKKSRCTNLIWVVRDQAMLEFYLEKAYLEHEGWSLIFYTGKKPMLSTLIESLAGSNVCVIRGRPSINVVIRNLIYGIESGIGVPKRYVPDQKKEAQQVLVKKLYELDQQRMGTREIVHELSLLAAELGFLFSDLIDDLSSSSTGHSSQLVGAIQEISELEDDTGSETNTNLPASGKGRPIAGEMCDSTILRGLRHIQGTRSIMAVRESNLDAAPLSPLIPSPMSPPTIQSQQAPRRSLLQRNLSLTESRRSVFSAIMQEMNVLFSLGKSTKTRMILLSSCQAMC